MRKVRRTTRFGIGTRLALGFGVVCALLAVAVSAAGLLIGRTDERALAIVAKRLPASEQSLMMAAHFTASVAAVYRYLLTRSPRDRTVLDGEWASIVEAGDKVDAVSDAFEPKMRTAWKALMTEFDEIYRVEYDLIADVDGAKQSGGTSEQLHERMADMERRVEHILVVLSGAEDEHGERRGGISGDEAWLLAEDANGIHSALYLLERGMWGLLAASLTLSALIAAATSRSIVEPIGAITRAMTKLAGGDTESPVPAVARRDEVGAMAKAVEVFRENSIRLSQQEEELRTARDEAVSASRAKSEFLSSISHELRTPLNAVIGFATLIRDATIGPIGDQRYSEYANHIGSSGQQLLASINDIIDYTRFEAGRTELQIEQIDLKRLFSVTVAAIAPTAVMVDVTVETAAIPEDVTVRGDERLLRRAIANLLSNAIKFCASAGRVKLEHRRVEGVTELSVSDTGIGMRKDEIARVLKPFVQVDGSLSRRHGGIGLGLPLAKAIAELHGGTLAITSTPGSGTTVTIRLPNA